MTSLAGPPPLERRKVALFLDLDGTIAPIAATPSNVQPDARRTRLLERLNSALEGRLAILSGRTLADVDRILERAVEPVAAIHGLVRRDAAGEHRAPANFVGLERARRSLANLAKAYEGIVIEDKNLSLAVHYRSAAHWAEPVKAHVAELSRQTGLSIQPGSCVLELRPRGPNKGDSLREFMETAPFRGGLPVMVGDDDTDESAFAAAANLGGYSVLVGASRPTAARYRFASVDAVLAWLEPEGRE